MSPSSGPPSLKPFRNQIFAQDGDVREVPVTLAEVEAVADHEAVRNLEADVAHGDVDLAARGLRHQRADLEACRLAGFEVPHQVGQGQAGVDDVLNDEDVAGLDVDVEVLQD